MTRLLIGLLYCVVGWAQPKFEDYPVAKPFQGKPAGAKVERAGDRMFRTRIREGAAKGPNFAGRFTVVQWGCGAGCVSTVIVDAGNGTVYHLPGAELGCTDLMCSMNMLCQTGDAPWYRLDSELLIVRHCNGDVARTDYLRWTGTKFVAVK
jgi:hypothetical protein